MMEDAMRINSDINRYKLIIVAMMSALMMSLLMTGCGNKPNNNGSVKAEDGRSYGGLIEGELGKTVHTVFFDLTVDSAKKCGTYQFMDGLYIADAGQTYLEVEVTITNTYDKDLPMSISDFTLDFSENESETAVIGFGSTELGNEEYMDNIFTLKQGDSISKKILYTVADRAEYLLCYKEFYEDKFEGDSYEIKMVPEILEPAVTTEAVTENASEEAITDSIENVNGDNSGEGNGDADSAAGDNGETGTSSDNQDSENIDDTDGGDTGIIEQ